MKEEPTQLYVSVCAPDEATFKRVCCLQTEKAWEKLNETLSLLQSLKCPNVIRMTLARDVNMNSFEGYAELVERGQPDVH
jgi:tRNA wybutosine-synthesizing protein 1